MLGTLPTELDTVALSPEIRHFLTRLLEDAGITPTNEELTEKMLGDLAARLQQQIILDLLDKMPEATFDAFEKLMETNPSADRIIGFLKLNVENHADLIAQSMMNFKDNFVTAVTA